MVTFRLSYFLIAFLKNHNNKISHTKAIKTIVTAQINIDKFITKFINYIIKNIPIINTITTTTKFNVAA
jgi:hypothetical protein